MSQVSEDRPGFGDVEIAVVGPLRPAVVTELEKHFVVHHAWKDTAAVLGGIGGNVRGVASSGIAGLSRRSMEQLPKLEICAIHGVGLETTDLTFARERGVTVTIAPVLYDDVADLAIALALAAARRIVEGDRFLREGKWLEGRFSPGRKFTGMRAGILGLGRIGTEIARRLEGFRVDIAYCDPVARDVPYRRYPDALALAANSDVLFLAAAGAAKGEAPPIVGKAIIEALGPRGIFVNVSRGWLVDEAALVAALAEGRLGAAGLDVFDDEPNVPAELIALDNVVLTPHIASWTAETVAAMGDNVVANLVSWFSGKGALTPVP
jgi:lactate dehydrogenase-like 2-hydroxyacid dehydrogenase